MCLVPHLYLCSALSCLSVLIETVSAAFSLRSKRLCIQKHSDWSLQFLAAADEMCICLFAFCLFVFCLIRIRFMHSVTDVFGTTIWLPVERRMGRVRRRMRSRHAICEPLTTHRFCPMPTSNSCAFTRGCALKGICSIICGPTECGTHDIFSIG